MRLHWRAALLAVLALTLTAGGALASGFSVYEQSAKASGLAGAWVAQADDAAANWYNPAALVWLEDREFQFGGNIISGGLDTELTVLDPSFGVFTPTDFETETNFVTPIHVYYAAKINDRISWGFGLNNPFGLVTEWSDRPVVFSAQKSELVTFVLNPNIAFKLNDSWSLALGVDYIYADIGEFSRQVPIDLDGNPLNGFEVIGRSNLTGDGDDVGFNLALSYRGPAVSFGFTYRSELSPEIDGEAEFSNFGPLSPFFPNGGGTATVDLPAQAVAALAWQAGGSWTFEVDLAFAGWSSFETLDIDFANNTPFLADVSLLEDWDDTFSYRFGAAYRSSEQHEWRFGLVYDESPVPETTLRPSIPDSDRWAPTVGYGFSGAKWDIDLYYMPLFFDDSTAVPGEEGVIAGEYSSTVQLAGITFNWRIR